MELQGYFNIPEPKLAFDALSQSAFDIHPLRGLIDYGPFSNRLMPLQKIRIAAIYPEGTYHIIHNLIREFTKVHKPQERQKYLPDYTGFEKIFRSTIELANQDVS